jgi:hypothetical protein
VARLSPVKGLRDRRDQDGAGWCWSCIQQEAAVLVHRSWCQLTTPYSPQQNDVVERRNQTVVEIARSMMKAKNLSGYFWGEAVTAVVYLLNRSPTRSVKGWMSYEAWHGRKPSVEHLRTFGSVVYIKNTKPHLKKLEDQSTKMVFVGYEAGTKGYRAYDPWIGQVDITHDAVFDELAQWDCSEDSGVRNDINPEFTVTTTTTVQEPGVLQEMPTRQEVLRRPRHH